MKKTIKIIITTVIILLVLGIIITIKIVAGNMTKIPDNEPYEQGFTAGNLYNGGYFAEKNGKVYFSNAYDGNNLYCMNPDQSEMIKLAGGNLKYINVLGDYIYYYSQTSGDQAGLGYVRNGRGIYRTDTKGKKTFLVTRCTTDGMMAVGNFIYFIDFAEDENDMANVTLQKISTSGEGQDMIINDHIAIGGYSGGNIIYGGNTGDHHLYAYNLSTKSSSKLLDINVYMPIVDNGYIYYLDLNNEYTLNRISLSDSTIETVVNERIDTYNVYNGIVYYQNCDPDNYALKRVISGGEPEVVANGVYSDINITSTYTYFRGFQNELPIYQTPTNGGLNVTTFDAARDGAIQN